MEYVISDHAIIVSAPNQIACDLDDEKVILNLDSGVYFGLDAIGAHIWHLIQEPKSVAEIQNLLLAEYDVNRETCRRDLLALLRDMAAQKLIEVRDGTDS